MAEYGLTPQGLIIRTFENLNELVTAAVTSAIGVVPVDALLTFIQIYNERLAELWLLAQQIYSAGDVSAAVGDAQDKLYAITGTKRQKATSSTVIATFTGDAGQSILVGTRVRVRVTLQPFETIEPGVLVARDAWAPNTDYTVGDLVTNDTKIYVALDDGTSASSGGPTGTGTSISDNTCVWSYLGDGTASVDIPTAAVFTGPIVALAGTLGPLLDSPLAGVLNVTNQTDAVVGTDVEIDADYRVRREQELAQPGSGTASAILAALSEVKGISNIVVFQNRTDATVDGMPPHSVEVLARGGDSLVIASLIQQNVDAGVNTFGNQTVAVTDADGFVENIQFSRPVEILIYNDLILSVDASVFPTDGVDRVKAAIVAYGAASKSGTNATSYRVGVVIGSVPGVLDIPQNRIKAGSAPGPGDTSAITIAARELAVYDTGRIVVATTPGSP